MDSAYSLIPMVRKPCINSGDSFEIEVFLTGHGKGIKDNKFRVSYSSPLLLQADDKGKVGYAQTCIKALMSREGKFVGLITGNREIKNPQTGELEKAIQTVDLDTVGTVVVLNEGYFAKIPGDNIMSAGDMTHDGHPPILLKFNTSPKAPSGDYKIFLTLFYSEGTEVGLDEKIVGIHINSWIEKHQRKLQIIAISLGMLALVAGLIQAIYTILQYLKQVPGLDGGFFSSHEI